MNPADKLAAPPESHGHLNPGVSPPIARYAPEPDLVDLVRHYWVPEWSLPDGVEVTADVLGYPALNIVVDRGVVLLVGPMSRSSSRTLTGSGWAVGALLRPAATIAFGYDASRLVDVVLSLDQPTLLARVSEIMDARVAPADMREDVRGDVRGDIAPTSSERHLAATRVLGEWIRETAAPAGRPLTSQGILANLFEDRVERLDAHSRLSEVARDLAVSERTLQRAVRRTTGFTPAQVLRRHRVQEVAARLRTEPPIVLSDLAAEAGYADHAHMTREVRDVLATTPSRLRRLDR